MRTNGSFQYLLVKVEDAIGVITLNRPEVLNACNTAMHEEIQQAFNHLEDDENVNVIVVAAAGRAFCAGSDLKEIGPFAGELQRRYVQLDFGTKNRVAACRKPVIAAIQGHAVGGGFELAVACDIRFVAEDVSFCFREIVLGTIPGSGGLERVVPLVGLGIAKEWAFSGATIGAAEAYRTGLANRVVPRDRLMDETMAFARIVAQRSSLALALSKVSLDPHPMTDTGITATFHMLASAACHDNPKYHQAAAKIGGDKP